MLREVNEEQSKKAFILIEVTLLGMVTDVKEEQRENAPQPIEVEGDYSRIIDSYFRMIIIFKGRIIRIVKAIRDEGKCKRSFTDTGRPN